MGKLSYVSSNHGLYLSLYGGQDRIWSRYTDDRFGPEERFRGWLQWGNLTGSLRWQGALAPHILAQGSIARTAYGLGFFENLEETRPDNNYTSTEEVRLSSGVVDWSLNGDLSVATQIGLTLRHWRHLYDTRFTPNSTRSVFENGVLQGGQALFRGEATIARLFLECVYRY